MSDATEQREFVQEAPRKIPVRAYVDVVVAGAGPAGIAAAIAAARNGAKTLLVERYGYLGGLSTAEYSSVQGTGSVGMGFHDVTGRHIVGGIAWELMQRITERAGAIGPFPRTVISNLKDGYLDVPHSRFGPQTDTEVLKAVVLEAVQEAGVRLLLHTWAVDAVMVDGTIKGIIIQSKSGREAILAKCVVDATADADIAAAAGAPWEETPKGQLYRMAVDLHLANVDGERVRAYVKEHMDQFAYVTFPVDGSQVPAGFQLPIRGEMELGDRGDLKVRDDHLLLTASRPRAAVKIGIRPGTSSVSAGYNGDPTDVEDLTQAEIVGRQEALASIEWLRQNIPGFENCFVSGESPLGTRESRRIVGDYVVTEDDLRQGRRFPDTIGQNNMPFDCHLGNGGWYYEVLTIPHDIPYRCLVPRGVENMLVAGRSVSADHMAQSSLRKVTTCMTTGQAAGTAAALAVQAGVNPRHLDVSVLQAKLSEQGVILDRVEAQHIVQPPVAK